MDFTFVAASLVGVALVVATYVTPKARLLRNAFAKGDFGDRILLIMIPGLTLMCLGVSIFEALATYAKGLSWWRVWGIPLSGLLALVGFGLALWALFPAPVPGWIRPRWMQEERLGAALGSLRRVQKAQARRDREISQRGFAYFRPQVIDGVSLAYPDNWVLNLAPGIPRAVPGVRLHSRFAVDTPHDFRPRARFLVMTGEICRNNPGKPGQSGESRLLGESRLSNEAKKSGKEPNEGGIAGAVRLAGDSGAAKETGMLELTEEANPSSPSPVPASPDEQLGLDIEASLNGKTSNDIDSVTDSVTDMTEPGFNPRETGLAPDPGSVPAAPAANPTDTPAADPIAPSVADTSEIMEILRRTAVPPGWEVVEARGDTFAGVPGICTITRLGSGKGIQQRWTVAVGNRIWTAAFQVAGKDFGVLRGLGDKIAASLTLIPDDPAFARED